MSVVCLTVATRSSNIHISGKIIKEMLGSVASGSPYITVFLHPVLIVWISQTVINPLSCQHGE